MTILTPRGRGLGRKKDRGDLRDHRFAQVHPEAMALALPPNVDLRPQLPACWDQLRTNSCGPHAGAALMCFLYPEVAEAFSRLQIYYGVRVIEGDVDEDDGVETRDVLATLMVTGAAPESLWPFDATKMFVAPPQAVFDAASRYTLSRYARLSSQDEILACLASKFPFVLGFNVPEELDSNAVATTGVLPIPATPSNIGGHDTLVVGYDRDFLNNPDFIRSKLSASQVDSTALLVRNSWGPFWGIKGHFWMPLKFAIDQATDIDAWTGRRSLIPATKGSDMPTPATAATDPDMLTAGRNAARQVVDTFRYMGIPVSSHVTDEEIDQLVIAVDNALTSYRNDPSI